MRWQLRYRDWVMLAWAKIQTVVAALLEQLLGSRFARRIGGMSTSTLVINRKQT